MRTVMRQRAERFAPLLEALAAEERSQRWLANKLGMTPRRMYALSDGITIPPADFFERAAAALGVSVEQVDGAYRSEPARGTPTRQPRRSQSQQSQQSQRSA